MNEAQSEEKTRVTLCEVGKCYWEADSYQHREALLETIQNSDCRATLASAVNGDELAMVFTQTAYRGHVNLTSAFLDNGINVDILDAWDCSALIRSCMQTGNDQTIKLLLDRNANLDFQNRNGETALMMVTNDCRSKFVELFLQKNANPDIQDNEGQTALMIACENNHTKIVQLLLSYNADINLKNNEGEKALDLTSKKEIKELLRNHVTASYILK